MEDGTGAGVVLDELDGAMLIDDSVQPPHDTGHGGGGVDIHERLPPVGDAEFTPELGVPDSMPVERGEPSSDERGPPLSLLMKLEGDEPGTENITPRTSVEKEPSPMCADDELLLDGGVITVPQELVVMLDSVQF
jgi:hypothetical protein